MSTRASYFGGDALPVGTVAVGINRGTAASPTPARSASTVLVECQDAAVRYRFDGTDPSSSVGMVLEPGDTFDMDSQDQIQKFRAVRRDGADAVLFCSYGYGN